MLAARCRAEVPLKGKHAADAVSKLGAVERYRGPGGPRAAGMENSTRQQRQYSKGRMAEPGGDEDQILQQQTEKRSDKTREGISGQHSI